MLFALTKRVLTEARPKVVAKFVYNFGVKGVRSVELHKRRRRRGENFPPFLFISVISSCQLRCQGCWVDVAAPTQKLSLDELNRIVGDAKAHGNAYFGILGGEPFLHPQLLDLFAAHPDCYFQVFTNGQLITDEIARRARAAGQRHAAPEHRRLGDRERRAPRPDAGADQDARGSRGLPAPRLLIGVATSVCQTNIELVSEAWLRRLIAMGVHYVWFHTYRVVGPKPNPQLALRPEQVLAVRRFIVQMRARLPIAIVDAYWDDRGEALCPMATGVSHHIGPGGHIEPCPVIQFATSTVRDGPSIYETMTQSAFLRDFREAAAGATQGCIVLERPDIVRDLVRKHGAQRLDAARHGDGGVRGDDAAPEPAQSRRRDPGRALGVPVRQEALVLRIRRVFVDGDRPS